MADVLSQYSGINVLKLFVFLYQVIQYSSYYLPVLYHDRNLFATIFALFLKNYFLTNLEIYRKIQDLIQYQQFSSLIIEKLVCSIKIIICSTEIFLIFLALGNYHKINWLESLKINGNTNTNNPLEEQTQHNKKYKIQVFQCDYHFKYIIIVDSSLICFIQTFSYCNC